MATSKNPELEAAIAWYHSHPKILDQYGGEWVAIGPGGVLSHSKDVKEIVAASKKQGIRRPLLHKVPPVGILALLRMRKPLLQSPLGENALRTAGKVL